MILPTRFQGATFDSYETTTSRQERVREMCRAYAMTFTDCRYQGRNLVLCGNVGTGKTHLACAIGRGVEEHLEVVHQNDNDGRPMPHNPEFDSVTYSTVQDMLRYIKTSYGRDCTYSERQAIKRFTGPDLLVLDEVGVQTGSDHEKMLLTGILDDRWANGNATVVVSNMTKSEVMAYLGARASDRLFDGESTLIAFDWESYRGRRKIDGIQPRNRVFPDLRYTLEPQESPTAESLEAARQNINRLRKMVGMQVIAGGKTGSAA